MASINQLEDEGSVIGYRPYLEYNKNNQQDDDALKIDTVSVSDTVSNLDKTGTIQYSNAVSTLSETHPSVVVSNLNNTISNLSALIDDLTKAFKQGDWTEYKDISLFISGLESGNNEYTDKFLHYHSSNPNGSVIPELISYIQDSKYRVQELISTLNELFYGQYNITQQEAEEIDKANIAQLKLNEETGQSGKNNYFAVSSDALLCRLINAHSYGVSKKGVDIAASGLSPDKSFNTSVVEDVLYDLYANVNNELTARHQTYSIQNNISVMKQSLYRYYSDRRNVIQLLKLFLDSRQSVIIGRKLIDKEQVLKNTTLNIARALKANEQYMKNIASLENEKRYIMDVYRKFNYRS